MGFFDSKKAQEAIQDGKRKVRKADREAREQGGQLCHSCAEQTATTTRGGDPLCSGCS